LYSALDELTRALIYDSILTKAKLETIKRQIAKKHNLNRFIRNSEILEFIHASEHLTERKKEILTHFLQIRKVRTISGLAVVAVMTKPFQCPGKCIYCPDIDGAPKSYTGKEPAAMRGIQNNFVPKKQVLARIKQLKSIGHDLDKIHLVVMGGTFLATPTEYQEFFVKECIDGITGEISTDMNIAKQFAESSHQRNVGITFETRPDYCRTSHVSRMLELGGTICEIGVQSLSKKVLDLIQRHHSLEEIKNAIQCARDGGLKVTVHMMPNLFQSPKEDIQMFKTLFTDPRYIPDAVKIYPTLVLQNTKLYELWKKKIYLPYGSEEVINVITAIKAIIPQFIRIQRVQRDIPAYLIVDGVRSGNLRELARNKLHQQNKKCSCIRCREVGHQTNLGDTSWIGKEKKFNFIQYSASEGIEHFISFETIDNETLFGFLRLRELSSNTFRPETIDPSVTIIRELHVYGKLVGIGKIPKELEWQHRGIGQKLISIAEEISIDKGFNKILVTSGLGVRDYYRKFGYKKDGVYMGKRL
jgi:elongator complex protein 3